MGVSNEIANELVGADEHGMHRLRRDPRVRRWLLAKRPTFGRKERGSDDFVQQVIDYRTQACLGFNLAAEAGADDDVLDFLEGEHDWSMGQIRDLAPEVFARLVGPR